jgi:arylsulfatase A-like enzyme
VADCDELYDSEIAYVDYHIGLLLDGLRERSRLDDALVIFAADHGENLGEQGVYFEHGPNVHDASLRIPLIVAGDGIDPRRDSDAVALEDLMPTILSLLRVPPGRRPKSDGSDISSRLVRGIAETSAPNPLRFAESGSTFHWDATHSIFAGLRGGPRCIHDTRFSLCGHETIEKLLFDRLKDPRFLVDVSEEYPQEKERLMAIWDAWLVEEKRELTVRNGRFKLTRFPLLDGGYRSELYDLTDTNGMDRNVIDEHRELASELARALDEWAQDRGSSDDGEFRSPEQLKTLEALGYL